VQISRFADAAATRPSPQSLRAFTVTYLRGHPLPAGGSVIVSLVGRGLVVTGNTTPLIQDPRIRGWFAAPPLSTVAYAETVRGTPLEIVATPLRFGGRTVGTYVATADLAPFDRQRAHVLGLSIAEAAIALLVGVASAFLLLRRLLRRVGRITATAEGIGTDVPEQRLGAQNDADEVGDLARTFDSMLDRVETSMRSQRRLLSDVSHQLRTPVTVARGHLEVLNRSGEADGASVHETLELVIDELDQMTAMIERLLSLGRAMEPELLVTEDVSLPELLTVTLDGVHVLACRDFQLVAPPGIVLHVDRRQLRGALTNLLDNAIKATRDGDRIDLGATVDASGRVTIAVDDAGTGIPPAQREAVLQRFSRPGARDEDGSGLGLAIAKAVALAHHGEIEVGDSQLGGARVAIILPASAVLTESSR
jgi:signal transduction histidine kinase